MAAIHFDMILFGINFDTHLAHHSTVDRDPTGADHLLRRPSRRHPGIRNRLLQPHLHTAFTIP